MVEAGEPSGVGVAAGTRRARARPVRAFTAPPAIDPVVVAAPPAREDPGHSRLMTTILPALSSLGIVGFALVSGSVLYVVLGIGLSVLGIGAAIASQIGASRSRRRRQQRLRDRYGEHLDHRFLQLTEIADAQRRAAQRTDPDPSDWEAVLPGDHLWERRPGDPDFLSLRVGRGRVPLATPVRLEPAGPASDEEPDLRDEAELLVASAASVDDLPITIDLRHRRCLAVQGPLSVARPLMRALVLTLALTHAPDDVRLLHRSDSDDSTWLSRLPHALHADASDLDELANRIATVSGDAPLVLVLDAPAEDDLDGRRFLAGLASSTDERLHLLLLAEDATDVPPDADVLVAVDDDGALRLRFADGTPATIVARPDGVSSLEAARCAKGLEAAGFGGDRAPTGPVLLSSLLAGFERPAELALPLGRDELGRPLVLDLSEASSGGSGPHGLLVGATGSGKSELLRSILAGLVSRRSPAELAIVCWDFKGGAAIAPFMSLPHVRGVVTNLADEPRLLERAGRSLRAELLRRQRVLREHGVDSVSDLDAVAEHLPRLLLVVDEFSELVAAAPDLLDLFVSVGRLGRSLGIHLLLASQRFEEGRLRGLESHLRYRICLRTFSATDSQTVLGTDAAYRLPVAPGSGLLAVDGRLIRFDGALADALPALLEDVRGRCTGSSDTDDVWRPPLPHALPLPPPLPPAAALDLRATVGLVDLPDQQAQVPLVVDLGRGHLAAVGAPGSGRSTLLATLLASLALGNSSDELEVQVITGTPEVFGTLGDLPHVAAVASLDDEEAVRGLLSRLAGPGAPGSRSAEVPARGAGPRHVLLVVDDWTRLRRLAEDLTDVVAELAARGPRSGVHLAITATGWGEFRTGLREHLGLHLELRLSDVYESEHGRARAAGLPSVPGRLLTPEGDEAQAALPRADGVAGTTGIASAQRELVDLVRARGDRPVPRLRQVPSALDLADLARLRPNAVNGRTTGTVLLGGTADGGAESVSLTGPDRVLAIIGEAGSGRTTALQTVVLQLQTQEIDLWVIDPRRGLLPVLDAPVFDAPVHYAYTVDDGTALLGELAARLAPRRPPRGLSPADLLSHLRRADPGRPAVLLIDDYDLLSPVGLSGPLGPVGELLPYAADVGLSVVVARGGSGRFGYDAGWQALVDAGATGLLLSGDPADGPVHRGIRAQRRAPGRGLLVRRAVSATVVQVARPAPPALGRRPSVAPLRLRTA